MSYIVMYLPYTYFDPDLDSFFTFYTVRTVKCFNDTIVYLDGWRVEGRKGGVGLCVCVRVDMVEYEV